MTSEQVTVIFPIAGTSGHAGFKYRPFIEIGTETAIEVAARPFKKWSHVISRLVFVCLAEHEAEHGVTARIAQLFADRPHTVVALPRATSGPLETLVRGIEGATVSGRIIVCDSDHSIDVDPLFRAIGDGLGDCIFPAWSLRNEDLRHWAVAAVANSRVNGIAEKRLPQGNGDFVGALGCTFFADAAAVTSRYAAGDAYVSAVIAKMIDHGDRVMAVPVDNVEFFGSPQKLRSTRAKRNVRIGSIFCDIDGVLIEHEDVPDFARGLGVLPGSIDRLQHWMDEGYFIVLTTARDASQEEAMRRLLAAAAIPYHHLIMGLPSGPRFLINDRKPSALLVSQATALEVERNQGIQHLTISPSNLEVRSRFKGGSFAETLLVEDDEKLFVRKRVSKRENLRLGYSKLKNQYRTLERFSRMTADLVPALYGEHDNTIEYSYDMEYLPQHRLLSQCEPAERGHAVKTLLDVLGERVYGNASRNGRTGVDWLEAHLATKIYGRLDVMLGHARLTPLVTSKEISIDGVTYPGLQQLLTRVSSPAVMKRLAPTALCTVHGDLTFENVLYFKGDVRLIDMDGADYIDAPELDLGKLFQSIVARYEDWAHSDHALFETTQPEEFVCHYKPNAPEPELETICRDAWAQILSTSPDEVAIKGWFYMGLHLLRMVPFRLKVSDEQALYALASGIRWISHALDHRA